MKRIGLTALMAAALVVAACDRQEQDITAPRPEFSQAGSSSTAQSAMFALELTGDFVINSEQVWAFNRPTARTYFANAWNGVVPTPTCTGGGPSGANCAESNRPATPAAPAADVSKLSPIVSQNKCTFWSGGTLAVAAQHSSYTQSLTVKGLNGNGNFKFDYTYLISAGATNPVAAQTAWDLQSEDYQPAQVSFEGYLAGQSTVKSLNAKRNAPWTFKTSHSMTNPDGSARLQNLAATLYDAADYMVWSEPLGYTMEYGTDFLYNGNAGSNGPAGQLIDNAWVGRIHNGLASSPDGDTDNHVGNNSTLGERAVIYPYGFALSEAGNYKLRVSGILKGVDGGRDVSVNIDEQITISADDCS